LSLLYGVPFAQILPETLTFALDSILLASKLSSDVFPAPDAPKIAVTYPG
jgi:hypothetical protein